MLVEGGQIEFFNQFNAVFGIKAFLVLFLVFYSTFAIILYKQISIMNKKLPTKLAPLLRFLGVIHIGIAVALLFLVVGNF